MINSEKAIDPSDYADRSIGTEALLDDISNYSKQNNTTDFQMQGYFASPLAKEVDKAFDFIISNLTNDEKPVILYGLSMGGVNINDLADKLVNYGVKNPIILFTVDAYNPFRFTKGLTISTGVQTNFNFYQTTPASIFKSRGYPNESESDNVVNIEVTNVDHYSIDEATNHTVSGTIISYINRWKDR